MKKIKPTLGIGYPLKTYVFTGEFQGVLYGSDSITKCFKIVWAPIYVDYKGKKIIDITQIKGEGEING
ncbi:unnamed protein product [marine sediment metagenome]|uniref:Uncharacterized protein n=1 Tax=marine sediment metagenome TaxID=412755 RepID=X1KAN8_9ZZZZ